MVTQETRPFVYGRFLTLHVPPITSVIPPPAAPPPSIALEILREFSATELVGKVYVRGPAPGWVPMDPGILQGLEWYRDFGKKDWAVQFEMIPSGRWNVLNFRIESDERGPYLAAALKYASPQ